MSRIAGQGRLQGARRVSFRFDGVAYEGFEGETLAAALLANDVRLVGRSFKYHRPRGIVTAGSDEPNALVTVRGTPNIRATVQELYDGLEAQSQNAWPSLARDAMAVNDLLSPVLGAGFYYKTFMWPRRFWEAVYEPLIRRAAGLGALSPEPETRASEKAFAHCDLLVIGAGPAGLMAALTGARAGVDVILADEAPGVGGRLLGETYAVGGQDGAVWAAGVLAELRSHPNVRYLPRTTVTGVYDGSTYGALERVSEHLGDADPALPQACFWRIAARRAVLASGAHERMIAFPGNDRPGVMQASAVRSYLTLWGVAAGRRVAVFGNNDDSHRTARDLAAAGVRIAAFVDTRAEAPESDDFPVYAGAVVTGTKGRHGLREIALRQGARERMIWADCLAVSGGWNPAVHLTCHLGARPVWQPEIAGFVPAPNVVPGLEVAGAAAGVFSTHGALVTGRDAALRALGVQGGPEVPEAEDAPTRISAFWDVGATGRAWLDLQNDVTTKDVRQAAAENLQSVEHMKRYTTQGMATDQGKGSNVTALAILADATGRAIEQTGTTTFRPPYTPVPLGALGAGGQGVGFAPQRFVTSHAASVARGAPMVEAGLWYRPSYFPADGERHWRDSCDREVAMVRKAVGITDVSTLGKIDLQGADAAAFLDFVYTNRMSTLKPGRMRYGLMLREDGMVMDDGTCACLAPDHYVITTTTAAAGQVMAHLDFVSQAFRPRDDVSFISVTEHWAQFAVAGPKARDVLAEVLGAVPEIGFMGYAPVQIGGVAGRLFRVSFSGELGYELAVPARYGASLFDQLAHCAEALGGGAYGMEALNVLRIEKGFLTHAELDGRATAFDLGMAGMVSTAQDCIGQGAAKRAGLTGSERQQLVGLTAETEMSAGAHLFRKGAEAVRTQSQGHVTSACWSPTLGKYLALALLQDGRARHGEGLRMVDHLRDRDVACRACDPVFFDPDGGRARG